MSDPKLTAAAPAEPTPMQRYTLNADGVVRTGAAGDFVHESDYNALAARLAELDALYSDAVAAVLATNKRILDERTAREAAESLAAGLREQHARDSAELRKVCAERDKAERESDGRRVALFEKADEARREWMRAEAAEAELAAIKKDRDEGWPAHWRVRAMNAEAKLAQVRACQRYRLDAGSGSGGDVWLDSEPDAQGEYFLAADVLAAIGEGRGEGA